jgi:hypothetical protein
MPNLVDGYDPHACINAGPNVSLVTNVRPDVMRVTYFPFQIGYS